MSDEKQEGATPGPWTHYDDSNDGKTNRHEIAARGKTVPHIYCTTGCEDEDRANARLISAAPDMLEALKVARDFIEDISWRGRTDAYDQIAAAIDKATTPTIGAAVKKG